MRFPHLPDDRLRPGDVPGPAAPWADVAAFGHRYHAYRVAGSLGRVAELTVAAHAAWAEHGELPEALPRLRLALFHTVRAVGLDGVPDRDTEAWARALVAAVAAQVGDPHRPTQAG